MNADPRSDQAFRHRPDFAGSHRSRRGFLLVVVLAVLVLLSLACYEFSDRAVAERTASAKSVQLAEARCAALSGIDFVLASVSDPTFTSGDLFSAEFTELLVEQPIDESERVGFTICPIDMWHGPYPDDDDVEAGMMAYGVIPESGKININALAELEDVITLEDQREALLQLPGMTESIADTMLDFIDADSEARTFGTESDSADVLIRNRPLDSLDDLLALPEVTSVLLYGTDFNRNGRGDEGEEVDGEITIGLSSYLTVYGREPNVNPDGEPKIDLNQDSADLLEGELSAEFGDEVASFVRAFREEGQQAAQQNQRGFRRLTRVFGTMNLGTASLTGEIKSIADLIDASIEDGARTSPLVSTDATSLIDFYDYVSTTDATSLAGRIDINSAPVEILMGIGGLEEGVATAISERNDWNHPVELLTDGLVDLLTFRRIEPLLTTSGRVYSFSSIGYVDGGPMVRIDAVIDASSAPPRVLKQVDMTRVGVGRTLPMIRPSMAAELIDAGSQ